MAANSDEMSDLKLPSRRASSTIAAIP